MNAAEANAADQLTTLRRALSALDNHIELERKELKRRTAALEKIDAWMEHEADDDASSDYGDTTRAEGAATLDLARVMEDRGDIETAAILCERVLEHRRSTLGCAHPRTQAAVRKLASLFHDKGDVAAAAPLYREVLLERSAGLGDRHPKTLSASVDVAMACADLGQLEEAESLLREALFGQLEVHGKSHLETLCTIGNLADVLRQGGRIAEAFDIFGDSLNVAQKLLGPYHMVTLVLGAKAARLRHEGGRAKGDENEAEAALVQLEQVVLCMKRALGEDHPQAKKYGEVLDGIAS